MNSGGSGAETSQRPVRVLVVDDSEVFQAACRDVVASIPSFVEVGQAWTGEEGVLLAENVQPDMVVVDITLPGIDGLETCRRLRARNPAPLVVLCSVDEDPRRPGLNLPCSESPYLCKTAFSPTALLELWRRSRMAGAPPTSTAQTPARPIVGAAAPLDSREGAQRNRSYLSEVQFMSIGPVDLLVLKFPGNKFTGEIAPALRELVDADIIGIIDILLAVTDEQGNVSAMELSDDSDAYSAFQPVVKEINALLTPDDIDALGRQLGPNSSAAVMLFENKWATRFRDAALNANGEVVMFERIPKAVIDQLVAETAAAA